MKKFMTNGPKLTTSKIITVFLLVPFSIWAQTDYAVTFKGDTLRGSLKIMSYDQLDRLQWSNGGEKKVYSALQIKFIAKSGDVYEPIRYENTIKFMQVVKSGFLSLYTFSSQNSEGQYLSKKDGTGMEVPNLNFKRTMAKYLSECPEVSSRLEKGEFNRRDMERIIDLYNTCLQNNKDPYLSAAAKPKTIDNAKLLAVKNLVEKVNLEDFPSKKDALDLLTDIQAKISKDEAVPNYLMEGLKSYLNPIPSVSKELEVLVSSLKK
jgi:hypothetical protein